MAEDGPTIARIVEAADEVFMQRLCERRAADMIERLASTTSDGGE